MSQTVYVGAMNERILFQKNQTAVDQNANLVNAWTDYFSCRASVSSFGGSRQPGDQESAAGITSDHGQLTFTVRYCPELAVVDITGYRIVYRGEIYDILAIDPMNYQRISLKFRGKRVHR